MTLTITQEDHPDPATMAAIENGLVAYNTSMAGDSDSKPLWLVGRDEAGTIQAGLKGISFYGWLFVDWLWIAESSRGHNHGSTLLSQAEDIGRVRGCVGIFLDTYQFQAPGFYQKHGYKEFGRIENFPPGHSRLYFSKAL